MKSTIIGRVNEPLSTSRAKYSILSSVQRLFGRTWNDSSPLIKTMAITVDLVHGRPTNESFVTHVIKDLLEHRNGVAWVSVKKKLFGNGSIKSKIPVGGGVSCLCASPRGLLSMIL
jgi:hypothetical protein